MNNLLPQILTILLIMSFSLTILAQPSDFIEQIELPPLILADQFSGNSSNSLPKKSTSPNLSSAPAKGAGIIQFYQQETDISITGTLGVMSYEYKEIYQDSQDIEWSDNIRYIGGGITLDYNNLAFDIYAQQTMSGKDSLFETRPQENVIIYDDNTNLSRRDIAVNFSYKYNLPTKWRDTLLVSVGYKWGKTDINGARRRTPGSTEKTIYDTEEILFITGGPSIGISYGFFIGQNSQFGMNVAYTKLKNTKYTGRPVRVDDTDGFTFGVSWVGSITNELSYGLSLDRYSYEMIGTITDERSVSKPFTVKEQAISFKASISYAFDLF